jgi:uncharacterized membrane protein
MAPLQKRAFYALLLGLVLAAALVAVFTVRGVAALNEDEDFRFIVYGLWIGVPVVYLVLVNLTLRRPTQIDERDRRIMERATKTQVLGILFSLAAWVIALTEVYQESGQVPGIFLTLIFISILIISTLSQSLGILIGYWRSP